eukprot:1144956-Pelagomonas_calceolata.AAC.3
MRLLEVDDDDDDDKERDYDKTDDDDDDDGGSAQFIRHTIPDHTVQPAGIQIAGSCILCVQMHAPLVKGCLPKEMKSNSANTQSCQNSLQPRQSMAQPLGGTFVKSVCVKSMHACLTMPPPISLRACAAMESTTTSLTPWPDTTASKPCKAACVWLCACACACACVFAIMHVLIEGT